MLRAGVRNGCGNDGCNVVVATVIMAVVVMVMMIMVVNRYVLDTQCWCLEAFFPTTL